MSALTVYTFHTLYFHLVPTFILILLKNLYFYPWMFFCHLEGGRDEMWFKSDPHNSLVFKIQHWSGEIRGLLGILSLCVHHKALRELPNLPESQFSQSTLQKCLEDETKWNNVCQAQSPVCPALKPCLLASFNSPRTSLACGRIMIASGSSSLSGVCWPSGARR